MSGTNIIGHGQVLNLMVLTVATPISGVLSVDYGSNKVDTHDTTDAGTTGVTRTYIGGLEDPGDITVKLNLKPGDASQSTMKAAEDTTTHTFTHVLPATLATRTFSGVVVGWDESFPDDKPATATFKIKVSGPITST